MTEDNTIELELPDELMLQLMTMAHQRNQTFNDFVSDAIKRYALNTYVDAAENLAGQVGIALVELSTYLDELSDQDCLPHEALQSAHFDYTEAYKAYFGLSGHRSGS